MKNKAGRCFSENDTSDQALPLTLFLQVTTCRNTASGHPGVPAPPHLLELAHCYQTGNSIVRVLRGNTMKALDENSGLFFMPVMFRGKAGWVATAWMPELLPGVSVTQHNRDGKCRVTLSLTRPTTMPDGICYPVRNVLGCGRRGEPWAKRSESTNNGAARCA
ncbi:MAG: hypothetical protein WAW61_03730, partial [Methylococcaceae bacterium]